MNWRMRQMEPRDVPRVLELARQQNERDGTGYPVPVLFGPDGRLMENVPLALVTECAGVVQQADVFERTAELMCFGTEPRATAFACREMDRIGYLLRGRGYTGVHCFVPRMVAEHTERPLRRAGYERDDNNLAHFFRSLVEK